MLSTMLWGCQNAALASSGLGNEACLHLTVLKGLSPTCFPWLCLPNTNKLGLLNNSTDDGFSKQPEKVVAVAPLFHNSRVGGMLEACDYVFLVPKEIQTHFWRLSKWLTKAGGKCSPFLPSTLFVCAEKYPRFIGSGKEKKNPTNIMWVSVNMILHWSLFNTCLRRKCLFSVLF